MWSTGVFSGGIHRGVLIALSVVLTIAAGPIWCGHICPLGAFQELLWYVRQWYNGHRHDWTWAASTDRVKDPLSLKGFQFFRYGLSMVSLILFYLTGSQSFVSWDPLIYAFSPHSWSLFLVLILLVVAVASWGTYRPHCRYTCPVGALISFGNVWAPLAKYLPLRRISRCDFGVVSTREISCIRCGRCAPLNLRSNMRQPRTQAHTSDSQKKK